MDWEVMCELLLGADMLLLRRVEVEVMPDN